MEAIKKGLAAALALCCLSLLLLSAPTAPSPRPEETPLPESRPTPRPSLAPASVGLPETPAPEEPMPHDAALFPPPVGENIVATSITGGFQLKNETHYEVDIEALLAEGCPVRLPAEGPQILIIHTHSSEAYTPAGLDRYDSSDSYRTEDERYNIIRVGDELTAIFSEAGLRVLHDRGVYDFPSYTGSYGRSGEAIEAYLREYPDIAVVIDLHRDALSSGDIVYKTMAEEDGTVASQVMLLCGTNESGLEHPHWRDNLSLALLLQRAVTDRYPTLMRPVDLVAQRYNTHLTRGSLILEVGSSGNTLQEALAAIRLFGRAAAEALLGQVEGG